MLPIRTFLNVTIVVKKCNNYSCWRYKHNSFHFSMVLTNHLRCYLKPRNRALFFFKPYHVPLVARNHFSNRGGTVTRHSNISNLRIFLQSRSNKLLQPCKIMHFGIFLKSGSIIRTNLSCYFTNFSRHFSSKEGIDNDKEEEGTEVKNYSYCDKTSSESNGLNEPSIFKAKDFSGENVEQLLKNSASFEQTQVPGDVWSSSLYPVTTHKHRDQARRSIRPEIDPRKTSVLLFPGQGSQFVGMGENLLVFPNVKELYNVASEILKYDLLKMCLKGPQSELNKTINCQAAVMVTSLAAVERLRDEFPLAIQDCVAAAGFSVGEFAALVFAGALSFEDAVRLVKIRGEAMQAASELTPSGMMTVFGGADTKLKFACHAAQEWCIREGIPDPVCSVANFLFPDCKVIAGNEEALKFIQLNASDFRIRRWKRLPVSGAFHTKLMKPAKEVFFNAISSVKFSTPLIPVYSNVDSKPYKNEQQIANKLVDQLCKPVRWEQTMHVIYERPSTANFPRTFECGPGHSLKAILKMVNAKASDACSVVEV